MTSRKEELEHLLQSLSPTHLTLTDSSASHKWHLPLGAKESHFRLLIVSLMFEGKNTLDRQRLVHQCLKDSWGEPGEGLHALEITAFTPSEFEKN